MQRKSFGAVFSLLSTYEKTKEHFSMEKKIVDWSKNLWQSIKFQQAITL